MAKNLQLQITCGSYVLGIQNVVSEVGKPNGSQRNYNARVK